MQTFLPYSDFTACARILDSKRLGKQRVETLQIVKALLQPDYGWRHHPAVLMWKGYEEALGRYGMEVCHAWRRRGFADTCEPKILADLGRLGLELVRKQDELAAAGAVPPWLGDAALHRSHQSALLRKDPSCTDRPSPECPTTCPTSGRSAPSRRSRPNGAVSPLPSQARSAAPGAPRTRTRRASRPGRAAAQPARAGRAPARPSTRSGIQATAIDSPKSPEGQEALDGVGCQRLGGWEPQAGKFTNSSGVPTMMAWTLPPLAFMTQSWSTPAWVSKQPTRSLRPSGDQTGLKNSNRSVGRRSTLHSPRGALVG
jgi:hypothetical protein